MAQRGDPGNCLREMLAEWLRGMGDPPRTWSTIVAALGEVDGLEAIAKEIESKYNLVTRVTAPQGISFDVAVSKGMDFAHIIT